jgi:hypothetical protein
MARPNNRRFIIISDQQLDKPFVADTPDSRIKRAQPDDSANLEYGASHSGDKSKNFTLFAKKKHEQTAKSSLLLDYVC